MEASRARTGVSSAAEKVFTDVGRSDSVAHPDTDLDKQSPIASTSECFKDAGKSKDSNEGTNKKVRLKPIKTKVDWHERLRNIRSGKRGAKDSGSTMAYALFDENLYMDQREISSSKDSEAASKNPYTDAIPSSAIVKQLAIAVESGSNYNSMKELLVSSRGSSPIREKASLGLSAMKSLVLREKDDKLATEFGGDEKVLSVLNALLNAEGQFSGRAVPGLEAQMNATSLLKDIHAAPVESFVVKLSEAVGCIKTMRKMAEFWSRVVAELKRLWYEEQYIPGIPQDIIPDLNSCLLYQQLQVINCCISRKRRHNADIAALESLESVAVPASPHAAVSDSTLSLDPCFYVRTKSRELILRLGVGRKCDNLTLLETGETVYAPILQEPPLLTEDLVKETEEFVLRTGSVGAGCSQLLSDMQAFKAANPGCILEDFVRWHSPPDFVENETSNDSDGTSDGGNLSKVKGQLSTRMQKEGNLWRELWETSKPVPAVRQSPLYDVDLAVEGILNHLDDIPPSELFKQLFVVAFGSGLVIAEAMLSTNSSLSNFFNECKNYIVVTCQSNTWIEKLDDICQVYETVETMVLNQDEAIKLSTVRPEEETTAAGEMKNQFKKLSLIFGGKKGKDSPKNVEQAISSMFSKKPPKPAASPKPSGSVDGDWTLV